MDIKTLSTILGHISSKTTIDIYLHSTDEMKKNAADKINARFSMGKDADKKVQAEEEQKPQKTKFEPKKQNSDKHNKTRLARTKIRAIAFWCIKI